MTIYIPGITQFPQAIEEIDPIVKQSMLEDDNLILHEKMRAPSAC
jgi:hypothetical protein